MGLDFMRRFVPTQSNHRLELKEQSSRSLLELLVRYCRSVLGWSFRGARGLLILTRMAQIKIVSILGINIFHMWTSSKSGIDTTLDWTAKQTDTNQDKTRIELQKWTSFKDLFQPWNQFYPFYVNCVWTLRGKISILLGNQYAKNVNLTFWQHVNSKILQELNFSVCR